MMMRCKLTIICCVLGIFICSQSKAQQENVWAFGYGCGLDFSTGDPTIVPNSFDGFGESSASVCDEQGKLLFYTNGYEVWNKNGQLMPNGNGIVRDAALPPLPNTAFRDYISSSSQGTLIVPIPDQKGLYYIFSLTSTEVGVHRLYYSVVDLQREGGLGDIDPAQTSLLVSTDLTEHMTAVVGDHCNVWLLVIGRTTNTLKAYSISAIGIDPNPVSSPLLTVNHLNKIGAIDVAPNRRKLAIARTGMGLYDFDPASGKATGKVELNGYIPGTLAYNVCFSPNSSKLYASYVPLFGWSHTCYQFDLSSDDSTSIVKSAFNLTPAIATFKRGPDEKIYTSHNRRILFPNLPGAQCQFAENSFPQFCAGPGLPSVVAVFKRDTLYTSIQDSAGCFAQSHTLRASNDTSGWDYEWGHGALGPSIKADLPGKYWVKYHTPPCTYRVDTFDLVFPNGVLPRITLQNSCKDYAKGQAQASTFPGDTVIYRYTWFNGNMDTLSFSDTLRQVRSGNYFLKVSTINCDTLIPFFIPEEEGHVSFTLQDTLVCTYDTLDFINTSTGGFDHWQWAFDDDKETATFNSRHYYTQAGIYRVRLVGKSAVCADTAYQTLVVDAPVTEVKFSKDREYLCVGEIINLYPSKDSTMLHVGWNLGDESHLSTGPEPLQHAYDRKGIMSITLTAHFRACPDIIFRDTLRVFPIPTVILGPDTSLCPNSATIQLSNHTEAQPGEQYLWSTGEQTETIAIRQAGVYSLSITTTHGCSSTGSIWIRKDCYIDIPNAFTPDGNGVNDYFFPRQLLTGNLQQFQLSIFNRWGQLLYRTSNISGKGWDGQFNNQPQPPGVYTYDIEVNYAGHSSTERYQGNVTLIR